MDAVEEGGAEKIMSRSMKVYSNISKFCEILLYHYYVVSFPRVICSGALRGGKTGNFPVD